MLDFGCGSGRVLRNFLQEAQVAEIYGCDIHAESINWGKANLCPPLHMFQSDERPPLPLRDEQLDLIWTMSVFTHLTDTWSAWLLELHRILKPNGHPDRVVHGRGMSEILANEPWDESRIGMNVLGPGWDGRRAARWCCTRPGGSRRTGGARSRSSRFAPPA